MRVLLAAHRNEAPGIATVIRGLTTYLPSALGAGDELLVVGSRPQGPAAAGTRVSWRPRPSGLGGRYGRFVYEQAALPLLARSTDLVHVVDSRPLLLSARPFVITVHDLFVLDVPRWLPSSMRRFKARMLVAAVAKGPAAVVCVSHYTRERLFARVPASRNLDVRVIHPGLEPPSQSAPVPVGEPYFLTLSEINPRKNVLTLLRAFQLARRRGLKLRWKLAGPPGFRSERLVAALRSTEGVDVLGRVPDVQREALYRGAAFMAFPSHAEGFGLPPLEAMARGVPTVCSKGTALDETAGEAALRVEPEDVAGWVEALLRLEREDSLRADLVAAGRIQSQSFTVERMAAAHADLYHDIAAGSG
jgi:alpha-1,3-rhamnosyl/mannosyltransferase